MKTLKILSDLLPIPSYAVILICFFFPFITIKCGTTELVSVTGFDYVKGTDMKEKMKDSKFADQMQKKLGNDIFGATTEKDSTGTGSENADKSLALPEETGEEKQSRITMMLMMGTPFLMAIIGLIVCFAKVRRKVLFHILVSSIGFLVLLIFGLIIKNSDELNAVSSMADGMGGGMISIGLGTAYYLATILFLVILLFFGLEKYLKKLYKEGQEIREDTLEDFLNKE